MSRRRRRRLVVAVAGALIGLAAAGNRAAAAPPTPATPPTPAVSAAPVEVPTPAAVPTLPAGLPPPARPTLLPTPAPSATAAGVPSPAPSGAGTGDGGGGGDGGVLGWLTGWIDIPGRITGVINNWFTGLAQSAAQPVMRLLGRSLLSTPDITAQPRVAQLWTASIVIADGLFLLILTVAGIAIMGEGSVQTRATLKEFAPRAVIGLAGAHLSLFLMSQAIGLADALSRTLAGSQITADGAAQTLTTTILVSGIPIFQVLIVLAVLGLAVGVIIGWIIRMVVMMALAVAAPLMLIFQGLQWTDGVARLWWRALGGCLAVQVGQTLLILLGVRVLLSGDDNTILPSTTGLMNLLVCAALLFVAVRLQTWVTRIVLASSGKGRSVISTLIVYKAVRKAAAYAARAAA